MSYPPEVNKLCRCVCVPSPFPIKVYSVPQKRCLLDASARSGLYAARIHLSLTHPYWRPCIYCRASQALAARRASRSTTSRLSARSRARWTSGTCCSSRWSARWRASSRPCARASLRLTPRSPSRSSHPTRRRPLPASTAGRHRSCPSVGCCRAPARPPARARTRTAGAAAGALGPASHASPKQS